MKSFKLAFFGLAVALAFSSCEEEPPFIDFSEPEQGLIDTNYVGTVPTPQARVVLLEDLTGVRCVNCPDAQQKAKDIEAANPGKVVVMALHPFSLSTFTFPHSGGPDFRTQYAEDIINMIGIPSGLPFGTVDRQLFNGESSRTLEYQKWEAKVNSELTVTPAVNIDITGKQKIDDSTILVTVKVVYNEASTESHFLSVSLTESKIIGPQSKTGVGVIPDYEHNHILRTMATPYNGVKLNATLEPGRVFEKQVKLRVRSEWVLANCHIVAYVAKGVPDLTVLNAAQTDAE